MRIIALSDLHGNEFSPALLREIRVREPEAIVFLGDFTSNGSVLEAKRKLETLTKLSATMFIPGNCDNKEIGSLNINKAFPLHLSAMNFKGYWFAGHGGSNKTPFSTPLEYRESELKNNLEKLAKQAPRIDVFLTHAPPYKSCDKVFSGFSAGSAAIRRFLLEVQPRVCLCGHIHEGKGICKLKETVVVNPGPCFAGNFAVIELGEKVSVKLHSVD